MQEVDIEIEGTKPFVFHKFSIEAIQSLTKKKTGSAGNDPEEWKRSFFHQGSQLCVPDSYILAVLRHASVHTKAGRGSIQKTWMSAVSIIDEKIMMNRHIFDNWEDISAESIKDYTDSSKPVYIDVRMVSNPNTKGKNVRYRVCCSPGWTMKFSILVNDDLVSISQTKKVVEDAGLLIGIADARTLGYGRFRLTSFASRKV